MVGLVISFMQMNTKNNNNNQDTFALRHDLGPVLGLPIIILPWLMFGAITSNDWKSILPIAIFFLFLFLIIAWFQLDYRIWWKDSTIFQKATGGGITAIKPDEIRQIQQEKSDAQTLFAMRRPARRITIYAETHEGPKVIDVSLKHFNTRDIRKLMKMIHEQRPDLDMPEGWS